MRFAHWMAQASDLVGGLRVAVSQLNRNDGIGRDGRAVLRIRRDDRESVSLSGLSKTTWAIDPAMSGIGAIDTKTLLFI